MMNPYPIQILRCLSDTQESIETAAMALLQTRDQSSKLAWKGYKWKTTQNFKDNETKYTHASKFKPEDLEVREIKTFKLLVYLKKLPDGISVTKKERFLTSLLKAVKYNECLLMDVDNEVARIVGSDLRLMRKNMTGVLKVDDMDNINQFVENNSKKPMEEKEKNKLMAAYSSFNRFILTGQNNDLEIDVTDTGVLVCEINFLSSVQRSEENYLENAAEDFQSNTDDELFNSSSDEEDSKDDDSKILIQNKSSSSEFFVNINIKTSSLSSTCKQLTLKDACEPEKLRNFFYEELKKTFGITEESVKDFYLRIALNIVHEPESSDKDNLQWSKEELEEVLTVIIEDFKIKFLHELLDGYKDHSAVMKTIKDIVERHRSSGHHWIAERLFEAFLNSFTKDKLKKYLQETNSSTKGKGYILWLFKDALHKQKFKASLFYWSKLNFHLDSALMANYVISERLKLQTDVCEKKKFEKYVQKYQSIAVQILETCYREDWKLTMFSLIRELAKWKESCVTIAMTMKNKQFLQLRACCDVNSQAWSTYHGEDLDLDEHQGNFYEKWLSPKIRCRMDMIGYLLFLTAYSVLLVTYLSAKTFHFLEGVVIAYMLIFFLKELDQCCSKMCRNSKLCREYIMDPFNIIDLVTIVISFAAWGLRWVAFHLHDEQEWMKSARYLLSLNFMLYMFRFLEFFYLSKFLGPILVFIRHMVKTFLHFLLILMIFLVAYAVASESILYPETELTPDNVYNIFRKAFWAMMGEYWLDEISGDDCASNSTVYNNLTNQRCPTADGRFTVPVLLGIYVVFVQILMFNLLIALFTNAITENESKRDQIWRYQRLQLTMQYSETRLLLPPFTPLIFWLNSRVGNPFISRIPKQKIDLKHFEHTAAQKIIKKIMDYSLGKDHLDEEKKVNIKSVDATTKEILQLLKKERRGSVTFRAAQTNEMPDNELERVLNP